MILLGIDTALSFKVTFLSSSLAVAFLMWTTFQRCTLQFTLQRELPHFSISIEMPITTNLQKEILPGNIYYWHKLINGKLVISEQTDKGLCNIRILKSTNRVDYCFYYIPGCFFVPYSLNVHYRCCKHLCYFSTVA